MSRQWMAVWALALTLALGSSVAGCSAATEQPSTTPPAGSNSATGGAGGDEVSAGESLVAEKCSQCHSIDRVDAAVKDRDGWESTVTRMQRNGLEVTEEERETIVDWLTQRDANR